MFKEFVKQKFIIPFGRVIHGGLLKSPRNETMVARRKQRKYFIKWLLEPKINGCLLVTGTRGSGKTSFVNHCIAEHNLNLYSRIVQNNFSLKLLDILILFMIFILLTVILELSISMLFVESTSVLTKSIFGIIGMTPILIILLYGIMLCLALRSIKEQFQNILEDGEYSSFKGQINKLATWLWLKSIVFLLVSALIIVKVIYCWINFIIVKDPFSWINFIIVVAIYFHFLLYIVRSVYINIKIKIKNKSSYSMQIILGILILLFFIIVPCLVYEQFMSILTDLKNSGYLVTILVIIYMCIGYYLESNLISKLSLQEINFHNIEKQKRYANYLIQWSFPVIVLRHYVPSIYIKINLGFKDLKHENIIHAMLIDLKEKYREIFLGSDYAFNKLIPLILVFLSLFIWKGISDNLPKDVDIKDKIRSFSVNFDFSLVSIKSDGREESSPNSKILEFLKKPIFDGCIRIEKSIVSKFLSESKVKSELSENNCDDPYHFKFTLLDLIGTSLIFILSYFIVIYRPTSYYRKNIVKIEQLLRDFSSKVTKTQKGITRSLNKTVSSVVGNNESSVQSNPLNSRIAEIKMIQLLDDICKDQKGWFLSPGKIFNLASPSIIFVFDELDKLHNYNSMVNHLDFHDKQKSFTENEAARSNQINILLSDMKNFITTAKAKFIFVAGRDLHDQWLADENSREAFLTSIFDVELFISSLLTDHDDALADIKTNIVKYVNLQYERSKGDSSEYRNQKVRNNLISEKDLDQFAETFSILSEGKNYSRFTKLYNNLTIYRNKIINSNNNVYIKDVNITKLDKKDKYRFLYNFIQYLTYRSQGNPKQLRRIFYSFIQPTVIKNEKNINSKVYECVDALVFGDNEILRIQFLADVFYNINLKVGNYIVQSDDKMATSIFYLSDFIMKFHDLAFSWRHLSRLDELAHIHRLPELHKVFQSIIRQFSGLYLHKVLNGIFVFRFRSDISKELTYLSKVSDNDSAAYNFTLDESGDLKKIYKRKLKENESNHIDLITGLGELYDLDKEFDAARNEYNIAIKMLDENYNIRHSVNVDKPVSMVLSNNYNALKNNINWGSDRLTLMLMLGMTYERDNRQNSALTYYRDARSFTRKLVSTYLGYDDKNHKTSSVSDIFEIFKSSSEQNNKITRHNVLKYLNILYQPLFAEAWIIEKSPTGLDIGLGILEKGIGQLRSVLPFIKNIYGNTAVAPSNYGYSNFALIASQLHNKTGDLAFFKGNQNHMGKNLHGYLLRASYHYSVSLHELRRFIKYRSKTSRIKFDPTQTSESVSKFDKTDYVTLALSSNLMDIGESTLAKLDLLDIDMPIDENTNENILTEADCFYEKIEDWLSMSSIESNKNEEILTFKISNEISISCGPLSDWLGVWGLNQFRQSRYYKVKTIKKENYYPDVIKMTKTNSGIQRFLIGIHFSWTGIRYLEKGGYYESASKEYLELSNCISTILWWLTTLNKTKGLSCLIQKDYFAYFIKFAIECLKKAESVAYRNKHERLAPTLRKEFGNNLDDNINGDIKNKRPEFITSAYSIYLLCSSNSACNECFQILSILNKWKVLESNDMKVVLSEATEKNKLQKNEIIIQKFKEHLLFFRYPILNRLRGLSVLIYNSIITDLNVPKKNIKNEIKDLTATLLYHNDLYDSPFHFTHMESGLCAFLTYLAINDFLNENGSYEKFDKKLEKEDKRWYKNIARRHLRDSIGIHTMGKAFYENITGLYYLYDDFNDRRIHMSHALQMLGTSYAQKLLEDIDNK